MSGCFPDLVDKSIHRALNRAAQVLQRLYNFRNDAVQAEFDCRHLGPRVEDPPQAFAHVGMVGRKSTSR
jgi:hypothetical protein